MRIENRNYSKGKFHFCVELGDVTYWGNYSFDRWDFYLNSTLGVLGYTDGDKVIGGWTYEDVRKLVWLGKE